MNIRRNILTIVGPKLAIDVMVEIPEKLIIPIIHVRLDRKNKL